MTTPLFLLRCVEIGMDMWTEKGNDGATYSKIATQEDFDKF